MATRTRMKFGLAAVSALAMTACGGGDGSGSDGGNGPSLDTDYSDLRMAETSGEPMLAGDDASVLELLRNGLRVSLDAAVAQTTSVVSASAPQSQSFSDTTVQVEGVDEADLVEYDGTFLYTLLPEAAPYMPMPANPTAAASLSLVPGYFWPGYTTTLRIVRTDVDAATTVPVGEFKFDGRQASRPSMYQVGTNGAAARYLATLSQTNWLTFGALQPGFAPPRPNRIALELLDVSHPADVTRAWKLEMEGWLRTSRKVGDTLYVVSSYWPHLVALNPQPQSAADRQANELSIISADSAQLLPRAWQNGSESALLRSHDCLLPALSAQDAYRELVVITAINLTERRIADVACLSSGENGVYMSHDSLYVGGTRYRYGGPSGPTTVLHKFALRNGGLEYEASGSVEGVLGWNNPSYFMDEHQGDLRIVTTRQANSTLTNHLTVMREAPGKRLTAIATLPNAAHPETLGKPREQIRAVRFAGERAYIVTFLTIDPLYVIDLHTPTDPVIAGALDVPGFSTYLRPLGASHLIGIGQDADTRGFPLGVKVELFDVRDIAHPRSVGAHVFGRSWSEALFDPHALTFHTVPGASPRYRMAVSLNVYDTPHPPTGLFSWTHTGLHLFEASGLEGATPQLRFQGVVKAAQPTSDELWPAFVEPVRSVLHNDAVFYVYGNRLLSRKWQDVTP